MNSGEKPSAASAPLSEEEITRRRKAALAASLSGADTLEVVPSAHVADDDDVEVRPDQDDAAAEARREEVRQRLLRGENIGGVETTESDVTEASENSAVGPDGRVRRKNK